MSEDPTQKLPPAQDATLAQVLSAVQSLDARLARLEQKVEERLHDTRPIWEKVVADIAQLQAGQDALTGEVKTIRTELRDMNRKFSIFNDNLVQIQADYRDIYDRVRDMERLRA
jgi:outer membrane murein-binding lipoprotein Lpp